MPEPIVSIKKMKVKADTIEATVLVPTREILGVTESMAHRILQVLPSLGDQVCVSYGHARFKEEIVGTQTPHLLEHVAIELLVLEARLDSARERVYTGHTSWVDKSHCKEFLEKPNLCMQVQITYDNDLVTISALRTAAGLVCWAAGDNSQLSEQQTAFCEGAYGLLPDIACITRELHALRTS
jgi:hypothetical protein